MPGATRKLLQAAKALKRSGAGIIAGNLPDLAIIAVIGAGEPSVGAMTGAVAPMLSILPAIALLVGLVGGVHTLADVAAKRKRHNSDLCAEWVHLPQSGEAPRMWETKKGKSDGRVGHEPWDYQ